jgi:hypothetical protein
MLLPTPKVFERQLHLFTNTDDTIKPLNHFFTSFLYDVRLLVRKVDLHHRTTHWTGFVRFQPSS